MDNEAAIREAEAYLEWHAAMGVDLDVGNVPRNWFELSAQPAATPAQQVTAGAQRQAPQASPSRGPAPARARPAAAAPDEAVMDAREKASAAPSLEALHETLAGFDGCGLKATAKNLCFYRGAPQAPLMIIGEAPGRDEDLSGTPFVGPAGQLLDKMLAAIDLDDTGAHITNLVYWRPPGNRTPTPREALVCRPFLDRQIELVEPEVIMILGRPAVNNLLNNTESIMKQRGKWKTLTVNKLEIPVMPTLHPAYLLRTPLAKRMAWADLQAVRDKLKG